MKHEQPSKLEEGTLLRQTSKPQTYFRSLLMLVGHLVGTGLVFVSLFTVGWLVSFALAGLNKIHPFNAGVFVLVHKFELWLVYIDSALCFVVLLIGMVHFCRDVLETHL